MSEAAPGNLSILNARAYLYSLRERLPMFTIYDHPSDWPDFYVARMFVSLPEPAPSNFAIMDRDLERLQVTMEALGLVKLMRSPGDDPVIIGDVAVRTFIPDYPRWICTPCGTRLGSRIPKHATYHGDTCGWCGEQTSCTEPRDFGYPPAPKVK